MRRGVKPMYILFEGLDLAGKSTVCRRFAERFGEKWTIRSNSIIEHNPVFKTVNDLRKKGSLSPETLGNLFYSSLLLDLEWFEAPKTDTIQDSTIILRSLAYHTVNETPLLPDLFQSLLTRHPKFDFAFVCKASRETRLARLLIRRKENLGPEDFIVRDNYDKFMAMEECLVNHAIKTFNAHIIDTSDLEKEEGLDEVIRIMGV
ncbi:hypothetical protein GF413_05795 [Candidatus Micrarchaeota archaeon]|nr:hypothetical protein [Candidatus Micrarchaeota archaeon]